MKRVLIFSLLLGAIVCRNAFAQHLEYTGEYGPFEDARSLCIAGSYAYIAECDGSSLGIINISDPSNPEFVANYETADAVWVVSVKDGYAYMAMAPNHIAVVDISDPANPTLVATEPTTEQAVNLFISGNYLYATEFYGIEIFHITDPENPTSIYYSADLTYLSWDIYVSGNYAYVTDIDDAFNMCPLYPEICGLRIIDVTDPYQPLVIGSVDGISIYPIFVSGNYAYVSTSIISDSPLIIIDATDRSEPFIAGEYFLPNCRAIFVSGPYAFVPYRVDGTGNLEVIDITDPADPQLVTEHDTYGRPYDISVRDEYVYVLNNTSLDILKLVHPACQGSYIAGDCNCNGFPLQLSDVTAMVGMYRGSSLPCYVCDCPPHGFAFAATADPNGNCVAFELGDVVTEIGAYRGSSTASSCQDCPGLSR